MARNKRANCRNCGKTMRSDNIKRHMNACAKDGNSTTKKIDSSIDKLIPTIKSVSKRGLKKIVKEAVKEGTSEIARLVTEKLLGQIDNMLYEQLCSSSSSPSHFHLVNRQHQQNLDGGGTDWEGEETLHENIAVRRGLISADNTVIGLVDEDQKPKCGKCRKVFCRRKDMRRHEVTCGERECDVCHAVFSDSVALKRHKNVHTDKFKCKDCGKASAKGYGLARYQRAHSGAVSGSSTEYNCENAA